MFGNCFFLLFSISKNKFFGLKNRQLFLEYNACLAIFYITPFVYNNFLFLRLKNLFGNPK